MEHNHSIPKTKHQHRFLKAITTTLAVMLCATILQPIKSQAVVNTLEEAQYSDGGSASSSSNNKWLSTYAKGAGYLGQGVLVYLIERETGAAVAGTTPKAFACSTEMKSYELHAQDKYNKYAPVTRWESTYPLWNLGADITNNGGFIKNNTSFNTEAIKAWLRTPKGDGTNGIAMVQSIWEDECPGITKRFTKQEIILVAEPIIANQFASYQVINHYFDFTIEMSNKDILNKLKAFKSNYMKSSGLYYEGTGVSKDLKDWVNNNITRLEALEDISNPIIVKKLIEGIIQDTQTFNISTRAYSTLGNPIAGTSKMVAEYYDYLTAPSTRPNKSDAGRYYYRLASSAAAYIDKDTRICKKAIPEAYLWESGQAGKKSVRNYHSRDTLSTKSIGMLAMLAFTEDKTQGEGQTTCDESKLTEYPPEHPAPIESEGTTTIIKSYRIRNTETNTLTDRGTNTRSNLSNQILIEDEDDYKVIAWKTSTENITNLANFSVTWESSVPGIIGEQGDTITQVTLPSTHKYIYVLLEKSDNPDNSDEHTNYTIPQSSITRHIYLSQPDKRLDMPKIEAHTFTWYIPSFTEGSCKHTYTCNSSDCSSKSYGICNCNQCKSDCTIYLKSILPI